MSRDGLKKIYLIKSAGYEFAEIDLHDNTLLLGESGVGKTTLMRAVLFFYTMDYSDSVLNLTSDTKKSFNDWYFKEHNSHIVYEYTRHENRFLLVVSKTSKLHYTFIDVSNTTLSVTDIFIDGNQPVDFETLQENIQKNLLVSMSTTLKERYINTLHKRDIFGKKIKQETAVDFTLFEDIKSRKEFARTLSNIFASSSIRSTNIKKTIVTLIDNSTAQIALYDIRTNLNKFALEKKEIEKFEKKIPLIEELAQEYTRYKEHKKEFKYLANKVEYIHQHTTYKLQEIETKLTQLEEQKNESLQKYSFEKKYKEEQKSKQKTALDLALNEVRRLEEKEREFEKKNIVYLLQEYNNEGDYKAQMLSLKERYEALTSNVQEIENAYKKIFFTLEQNYEKNRFSQEQQFQKQKSSLESEINTLIQNKHTKIEQVTHSDTQEKRRLEEKAKQLTQEYNNLKVKQGELKHFPFNQEKIAKAQTTIEHYAQEIATLTATLTQNRLDIQEVEQEIANIKRDLEERMAKLNEKANATKQKLLATKQDIEQKLDFESPNLYGYLHRNDVKNKEKIVTYLKDEILFAHKDFEVQEGSDADSIFGLHVSFDEEFANDYKQEQLLQALTRVKEEIKTLNKQTQKEKHTLEDKASLQTKEKNRQRTVLYKAKEQYEGQLKNYTAYKQQAQIDLQEAKQEAQTLRTQENAKLNESLIKLESSQNKLQEEIEALEKTIAQKTIQIEQNIQERIAHHKERIKELEKELQHKLQELQEAFAKQKQEYEQEKLEALEKQGIDERVLSQLLEQEKALTQKLKAIEKSKATVLLYLELEKEFQKLPHKKEEIATLQHTYDEVCSDLERLEYLFKEDMHKLDVTFQKHKEVQLNLEKFAKEYKRKIATQPISESIQNNIVLDFSVAIERVDAEDILELVALFESIKGNEAEIKALVLRALKDLKFDNIFKIEIPRDFLEDVAYAKTAKELIEYIQKDKLTPLKDALSEQFKGEIRKITKELALFEEALLDIEAQIKFLGNTIRKAVQTFNVIDSIQIQSKGANNNLLESLQSLAEFYDAHSEHFLNGLFQENMQETHKVKEKLDSKVMELVELLNTSKESLTLEDGFVLEFKVVEKGNNLTWRQNIDDIGSNGTSTLVKSIINIAMLQMVSKNIIKESEILAHCILDEIGTISTDYFRELKEFVNRSGFVFLNGMPIEDDMLISMYPTIYVGQNYGSYSKMVLASKLEM